MKGRVKAVAVVGLGVALAVALGVQMRRASVGSSSGAEITPVQNVETLTKSESPSTQHDAPQPSPSDAEAPMPSAKGEDPWPDARSRSAEELESEIADHEARIEREDAIARLNRGDVTAEEREEYGRVFARIVDLKRVKLEKELEQAKAELSEIQKTHAQRLAAAGLKTPTTEKK